MNKVFIKSRAKINLGLHITAKRDDGYHDIETIFLPVELHDEIILVKNPVFEFDTDDPALSAERSDNLIVKAVKLLEQETGKTLGVSIYLQKNIPKGAGLGGGSSNAANVLNSLNEMFALDISDERMRELALQLGSDVPFFLHHKPAYATGRGEILQRIEVESPYHLLIVNPGIHVSTADAYKGVTPRVPEIPLNSLIENGVFNLAKQFRYLRNDFEATVFLKFPLIQSLKNDLLRRGAVFSLMSGSGSTVFAFFDDRKKTEEAYSVYRTEYIAFRQFAETQE